LEAEAEALIRDLGEAAYSEARRHEHEAGSDAIARDWGFVALAVARLIGRRVDVDPLVRLAMNAVLVPDRDAAASRLPGSLSGPRPADKPTRVCAATMHPFRIQFVGAAPDGGPPVLEEVEIRASDVSAAIVAAANIAWPPRTIGLRILDDEGREVFGRRKSDRRSGATDCAAPRSARPRPDESPRCESRKFASRRVLSFFLTSERRGLRCVPVMPCWISSVSATPQARHRAVSDQEVRSALRPCTGKAES
jgi:hypothetical protein